MVELDGRRGVMRLTCKLDDRQQSGLGLSFE